MRVDILVLRRFLYLTISVVILYFYIFAPPFKVIPFGTDKPIMVLSYIYLSYKKYWYDLYRFFKSEISILLLILLISAFISLVHRNSFTLLLYDILFNIECIPCAFALVIFFKYECKVKIENIVFVCSIIGAIISTFLLLNPELTYYTKTILLKYPEDLIDKFLYRGYGITDGLLFSYPVIQGLCFSFLLVYRGQYARIFRLFLPFLLLAVIANARSGFIPIFVTLLLIMIIQVRTLLKGVLISIFLILICMPVINFMIDNNEMLQLSIDWASTSLDIVNDALSGKKSENVEILLGDFLVFPSTIDEWILGSGRYLFGALVDSTDIGYILRLNYGGFIYLILWLSFSLFMAFRLFKINRGFSLILFISLIYFNYKADFFIVNPASRFLILLYVSLVLYPNSFNNFLNRKAKIQ